MKKIKVVNVISDTNIGGAGKCVLTYAANYDKEKFDLTVVVPKNSKLKPRIDAIGVKCIEAECIADESMSIKGIFAQKKLFKQLKCDVLHTHAALSARIAARLAGVKKIVYTRHCVYEPGRLMKSVFGKILNKTVAWLFCDKIIAVAEAAAKNLTDVGISRKKIEVVLNGIEPTKPLSDEEKQAQRKRFNVADGQMVVSLIARIEDVKGHDDYIAAAEILSKKGVDAKFIAAGTGARYEELKDNKYVDFVGFVEDVRNITGITDISINASFGTEATSLSLLEGMSLGIPAVVTNYGGNPGVIEDGENGILVSVHDSVALAQGIETLLKNKGLYDEMSKNAIRIFGEKFTAEVMSRQIENVYKTLVEGGIKNG